MLKINEDKIYMRPFLGIFRGVPSSASAEEEWLKWIAESSQAVIYYIVLHDTVELCGRMAVGCRDSGGRDECRLLRGLEQVHSRHPVAYRYCLEILRQQMQGARQERRTVPLFAKPVLEK